LSISVSVDRPDCPTITHRSSAANALGDLDEDQPEVGRISDDDVRAAAGRVASRGAAVLDDAVARVERGAEIREDRLLELRDGI
jgi:hypothetical protein